MPVSKKANLVNSFLVFLLKIIPQSLIRRILVVIQANPQIADSWGYFIRPIHYFEPLPDFSMIKSEDIFRKRCFDHINFNWKLQLEYAERLSKYAKEIQDLVDQFNNNNGNKGFDFFNNAYTEIDASVYYAFIREVKPSRIVEIGSGYSTFIASLALKQNIQDANYGHLTCVEPYPPQYLTDGDLNIDLIQVKLEDLDLQLFSELKSGDILFIDSTHTVKFGSDCFREILDILPQLPKGVFVHIHDMFFPYDYPEQWLIKDRKAWNEQYFVEAFLAYNSSFEIILANNWLCIEYPEVINKIWYLNNQSQKQTTHKAGGLWIKKI